MKKLILIAALLTATSSSATHLTEDQQRDARAAITANSNRMLSAMKIRAKEESKPANLTDEEAFQIAYAARENVLNSANARIAQLLAQGVTCTQINTAYGEMINQQVNKEPASTEGMIAYRKYIKARCALTADELE